MDKCCIKFIQNSGANQQIELFFLISLHLGWYYVERLADGQKGWVPISATREIESNHIRARNFKQRHAFLKLLTSMSATENNGHDLLNNNNNQTNKYHVTFED